MGQRCSRKDKTWDDYYGSGFLIIQAMTKYGKENFRKEHVADATSREELNQIEFEAITREWHNCHGEYNQRAFIPDPTLWTTLPNDRLEEMMLKRIAKVKRYLENNPNPSHVRAEKAYRDFLSSVDTAEVEKLYKELGSAPKVARILSVSSKKIYRYLHEKKLVNPSRTIAGTPMSTAQKLAIKDATLKRIYGNVCGICHSSTSTVRCKNHTLV